MERNLDRIPSFCNAKYNLDDITREKVTVNCFDLKITFFLATLPQIPAIPSKTWVSVERAA